MVVRVHSPAAVAVQILLAAQDPEKRRMHGYRECPWLRRDCWRSWQTATSICIIRAVYNSQKSCWDCGRAKHGDANSLPCLPAAPCPHENDTAVRVWCIIDSTWRSLVLLQNQDIATHNTALEPSTNVRRYDNMMRTRLHGTFVHGFAADDWRPSLSEQLKRRYHVILHHASSGTPCNTATSSWRIRQTCRFYEYELNQHATETQHHRPVSLQSRPDIKIKADIHLYIVRML